MLTPVQWNILVEKNSSSKNFGHKANLKLWKREVMKGVGWVEKVEADLNSELAMIGDADSQASWPLLTASTMLNNLHGEKNIDLFGATFTIVFT